MNVKVVPVSSKAKNRFINIMNSDPICTVEQQKNNMLFLASSNKKYFFWVDMNGNSDWIIKL